MRLGNRIGLLIRAKVAQWLRGGESDVDAALRRADETETLLEHLAQRISRARAREARLEGQIGQARALADQWESRADEALRRGDETAAREAIRQKMAYVKAAAELESSMSRQHAAAQELAGEMAKLESRMKRTESKAGEVPATSGAAPASDEAETPSLDALRERMSRAWSDGEIEEELEAMKQRLSADPGKKTG